jgi:hypothetical protein
VLCCCVQWTAHLCTVLSFESYRALTVVVARRRITLFNTSAIIFARFILETKLHLQTKEYQLKVSENTTDCKVFILWNISKAENQKQLMTFRTSYLLMKRLKKKKQKRKKRR